MLDVKAKHYSDLAYWDTRGFRARAVLYGDKVLAKLRLRKSRYQFSGPCDVMFITYRVKDLNSSSCALPFIRDDKGKEISAGPWRTEYDPKTRTGAVEVPLPKTPTNLAGCKLDLRVPVRLLWNLYGSYAVFSL